MARKTSGNIRGYLFTVVIRMLLERNGYTRIQPDAQNKFQVRKMRNDVIELRGRGCWHPVDCPYYAEKTAPFMPAVRLIGEVRYHMSEIKKESVRNFIGILKDLEEGKYLLDEHGDMTTMENRSDVGVFFSASGFWPEAERLAYIHGIRTISYKNNLQLKRLSEVIFEFESNYLDYDVVMQQGNFMAQFAMVLREELPASQLAGLYNLPQATIGLLEEMIKELRRIDSSFFASTPTGCMLHFLGEGAFPEELFSETDAAVCMMKLEPVDSGEKCYYLQFADDVQCRRFYFAPPEGLTDQNLYGAEDSEGKRNRVLYASVKIRGMERQICLKLDPDWKSALSF